MTTSGVEGTQRAHAGMGEVALAAAGVGAARTLGTTITNPTGAFNKVLTVQGAAIGATTAVAASYPGWYARITAMEDHGQTSTGLVEDAIVIAGAAAIMAKVSRDEI